MTRAGATVIGIGVVSPAGLGLAPLYEACARGATLIATDNTLGVPTGRVPIAALDDARQALAQDQLAASMLDARPSIRQRNQVRGGHLKTWRSRSDREEQRPSHQMMVSFHYVAALDQKLGARLLALPNVGTVIMFIMNSQDPQRVRNRTETKAEAWRSERRATNGRSARGC